MEENNDLRSFIEQIMDDIRKTYWSKIYENVENNPKLINQITGFLIKPEKIIFYLGPTHLAIEYVGSETIDALPLEFNVAVELIDYSGTKNNFMEEIIGFKYASTSGIDFMPVCNFMQDLIIPTNEGMKKLIELGWNFTAQDSCFGLNCPPPKLPKNEFARFINSFFFDSDGISLKTRHIKWIDFVPLDFDDSDGIHNNIAINVMSYYIKLVDLDTHFIYPMPEDYRNKKLPLINRFIELINSENVSEPEITKFLSLDEQKFILTMHFGASNIYSELVCEWQTGNNNDVKPDFFVLRSNGYADILEFKLPNLKSNSIVGRYNRETFSSELNGYISQTRVYEKYFDDPKNREWFEKKYGFKVYKPRRILVVGRRVDFNSEEWRDIQADYRNIEIITFDDLIDGATAQFYL